MLRTSLTTGRRRGMILIVVLSLLTLFAIVGITFVLVADSHALSSKLAAQAEQTFRPDLDPEAAFSMFLGQLVYDVEDDERGIYSGLRGHSFARTMYGYNDAAPAGNDKAFSGVGRPRITGPVGIPLPNMVNFTYFATDGFLLDPERTAWRTNPTQSKQGAYISAAVPYTYPDQHNFFLAMQKPSDGSILVPSFHRPFLFGSLAQSNPNWTSAAGRYLTVRPRPADHNGFPWPEDAGGDVKNLVGAPGGNDSIWIDIGAPVMTSADGRKYKMLVAPLILDLDNRINLNVHGNLRAGGSPGTTHASHQGWGRWEVNPARVLLNNELSNLIQGTPNAGNARLGGRYGADRQPGVTGSLASGGTSPRPWGPVDFDAIDDATGSLAQRFLLPGENTTQSYQSYPLFNAAFGNGSVPERTDHPLLYNPFRPYNDDRGFAVSNLAALLRRGDTGGQGLTSELTRLLPTTVADTRRRNLLTTHSADIDRPGATPYVWDRTSAGPAYTWDAAAGRPIATVPFAQPFDSLVANRGMTPAVPQSEFTTNWHSQVASLLRVNLNRPLAPYPTPDATGIITDMAGYNAAYNDRIFLAQDLFDRLWRVTGAPDPATVATGTSEFRTLRWLAQLAVNMVDYIDQDDYMTLFTWYQVGSTFDVVSGTETPGLLINEVFAQYENIPTDPGLQNRGAAVPPRPRAEAGFRINSWVELYNPRVPTPENPTGATRLMYPASGMNPARPVYQLSINNWALATNGPAMLGHPDNSYGDPTFVGMNPATVQPATPPSIVQDWPDTMAVPGEVLAGGTRFNDPGRVNNGFYIVGPPATYLDEPGIDPNLPVTHRSANMTYTLPLPRDGGSWLERRPVILLRRLACPHLAYDASLNPFITVDTYQYPVAPWEANPFLEDDAPNSRNMNLIPVEMRKAYGRYQPFGALELALQNPNPALVGQSQNTFFQHNYELTTAPNIGDPSVSLKTAGFDWLVHLDRQVVSPVELLQVSAWKPHQLTEKFVQMPGGIPQKHVAGWYEQETRLHRFLEFVQTAPRERGLHPGGRIPGKININTLTDIDVWRALCDVQQANRFYDSTTPDANVDAAYRRLIAQRSPDLVLDAAGQIQTWPVTSAGKPFWSLAQGAATGGDQLTAGSRGLENTLLAPTTGGDATSPRLLDPFASGGAVGAIHPYQNLELLTKVFNNVTTRSNVFGVWVTVGYFEVTDENARPVKLGAEIGRAEGRHIRHRFFSIVDRTKMEAIRFNGQFAADVIGNAGQRAYADFGAGPVTATNAETGKTWTLPDGAILTFNPDGDNAETAAVFLNSGTTTFQAEVNPYRLGLPPVGGTTLYTTAQLPIIQYGNPGPWKRYDPKKDPCVLYFSLID